jgi:hypothetical protein
MMSSAVAGMTLGYMFRLRMSSASSHRRLA